MSDTTDDSTEGTYLKHKVSKKFRNDSKSPSQSLHLSTELSAENLLSKLSSQLAKFVEDNGANNFESPNSSPSQQADDETISDSTSSESSSKSKNNFSKFERIEKQLRELQENLQINPSTENINQSVVVVAANSYIKSLESKAKGIENKISSLRRKLDEIEQRSDKSEEQLEKYPTMVLDKSFNILEANSLCRSLMKVEHGNELKDIKLSSLVTYVEQHRLEKFLKEASNTMLNKETREIFVKCLLCDAVGQQLVMKIRLMRSALNENHDQLHVILLPEDAI